MERKTIKTIKIYLGEKEDTKRIFEVIRMSLGLTLRGHRVLLFISSYSINAMESMREGERKELKEFLDAICDMGGEVIMKSDFTDFLLRDADFDITAV